MAERPDWAQPSIPGLMRPNAAPGAPWDAQAVRRAHRMPGEGELVISAASLGLVAVLADVLRVASWRVSLGHHGSAGRHGFPRPPRFPRPRQFPGHRGPAPPAQPAFAFTVAGARPGAAQWKPGHARANAGGRVRQRYVRGPTEALGVRVADGFGLASFPLTSADLLRHFLRGKGQAGRLPGRVADLRRGARLAALSGR